MYSKNCPCKDCQYKGCGPKHSTCEAYLNYVEERRKGYEKGKRIIDASDAIYNIKHKMPGYKHSVFRKKER